MTTNKDNHLQNRIKRISRHLELSKLANTTGQVAEADMPRVLSYASDISLAALSNAPRAAQHEHPDDISEVTLDSGLNSVPRSIFNFDYKSRYTNAAATSGLHNSGFSGKEASSVNSGTQKSPSIPIPQKISNAGRLDVRSPEFHPQPALSPALFGGRLQSMGNVDESAQQQSFEVEQESVSHSRESRSLQFSLEM